METHTGEVAIVASRKRDGFYKRGDKWWTRDPVTGRRVSTGCTDKEAARRWKAARERIAADPATAKAQAATIGEWIVAWLKMKKPQVSEATMNVANQKLGHFVRVWGGDLSLASVTPELLDAYVAQRRDEDVKDLTIMKEWTHLRSVLQLAKRGGCFPGDIDSLKPPDLHGTYDPRTRALTRPELGALLTSLEPWQGAWVALMVGLGLRYSEARRLLPSDIGSDRVTIRGTKTEGSLRTVPILSLYRPLLEPAFGYLPLKPWPAAHKTLKWACKRARIEYCSPNDLRRTHATMLLESGIDRDVIRRLLGHSSTAMLDKVYGQPRVEALALLAEAKLKHSVQLSGTLALPPSTSLAEGECPYNPEAPKATTEQAPTSGALSRDVTAGRDRHFDPIEFRRRSWEWLTRSAA